MALYDGKNSQYVKPGHGTAFDAEHKPGTAVPHSGIYRCKNCGDEVTCNKGDPLPPQNHSQHSGTTPIVWKLLVYTQTKAA